MPSRRRAADEGAPPIVGAEPLGGERPFEGVWRESYRSSKVSLAAYRFEPGAAFPRHSHPEEQITIFLEGDVEVKIGEETKGFGPGEVCVIAPEVEHEMRAGEEGARFVAMVVPPRERTDAYTILGGDGR